MLRAVQLAAPLLNKLAVLELPKETVLHYMPEDETEIGLPQDHAILINNTRVIMTEHVTQLGDDKGNPRTLPIPSAQMKREYHRQNRRTREMLRPETVMRDVNTIVVENYALLSHLYRYPTNYFRAYFKWWNIQAALWQRVGEISQNYPLRNQFLQCRLPTLLPTIGQLRRGEGEMTRNLLGSFVQPESLLILEIWKWLGERRENSVLSKCPPEALTKMNLIFIEQDRWLMLNLGLLDKWRKRTLEEGGNDTHKGILDPIMIQKRFLRLLMTLMEVRTGGEINEAPAGEIDTAVVNVDAQTAPGSKEDPDTSMTVARSEPVKLSVPTEDGRTAKIKLTANLNLDRLPDELIEETPENQLAIDEAITKDLEALDAIMARFQESQVEGEEDSPIDTSTGEVSTMLKYVPNERSLSGSVMAKMDQLADAGLCSGAEYRRMTALSTAYQRLPSPFGEGTLEDMSTIAHEDLVLSTESQIPDMLTVPDKTMLKSSILEYDKQYLNKIYRKDLVRSVLGVQHAGIAVTGFQMDEYKDVLNHYEKFAIQLTPVVGKVSTVYAKLPKINADGTYVDNGSRYRMRKQRGDVPIRKLSPSRVALTSYYNKVFISRSEKQISNYPGWLTNQIAAMAMDEDNGTIDHAMLADVSDTEIRTPRIYSILASRFRSFHLYEGDNAYVYEFFLDYHARKAQFGAERVEAIEKDGLLVIGKAQASGNLLVVDNTNTIYEAQGLELKTLGSIETMIGTLSGKPPAETAEIRIFGKQVPVGLFLAYHLGITKLFELLGVTPRKVPTGTRAYMNGDELAIRFEDEMWIFPQDQGMRTLILAGLASYDKITRNYSSHLFDRKDIYLPVLEQSRVGVRYLREMDLLVELFVDPITEDILKEMGEPTDFISLVLRACQLLETDWSPAETDMAYMRIKGYERFAGALYAELVKAIRQQRARGSIANAKIDMHPDAVWIGVSLDPVKKAVEESNPVHNAREREEVTYSGVGGRSERSMVGRTRVYHPNDLGVISESTKDSAQVAITTFMPADPTLLNVRGMARRFDPEKDGITSVMSTPALLSPAADRDDPKRVNFIPIQHSSGTFAKGYRQTPLRTGYERVLAHRNDDMFAASADQDGVVTSLDATRGMVVTYADGSTQSIKVGRRFGKAAGLVFPHQLTAMYQKGQSFKKGDILVYNERYYEPDRLTPGQVVWKAGLLVNTAIMENPDTLEDSSVISARVAADLETEITYVRDIVVAFDQSIHGLVEEGSEVEIESILCTIEDAVTAENSLFDENSLDMLRLLAANTPRAKYKGVVEKVEVFYHGEIDDMSTSLMEIAAESDRDRKRQARSLQEQAMNGKVDSSTRIQSKPLPADHLLIRVYITGAASAGVGDKAVFASQLKTVVGRVLNGVNETKSGLPVDAIFSYASISNRVVRSPEIMGITNVLLKLISKRMVSAYKKGK
ncbi:RNA polymerase beta subunit [Xanthomonas phage RTH11]|nr:RNA polymerase beta subunit [Xanthomonas phage RTH11]